MYTFKSLIISNTTMGDFSFFPKLRDLIGLIWKKTLRQEKKAILNILEAYINQIKSNI